MRARSIPEEHEPRILRWYLSGETYQAIADRLYEEHQIDTSNSSVRRLIERIAEGDCADGVLKAVTKLRLNAPQLADRVARHTLIAHKMAGFDEPVEVPAGITRQQLDFASRMTVRELKVAGCLGRDVDRAMDHARALAEEACQEEEEEMRDLREAARRHLERAREAAPQSTAPAPASIPQPPPERTRTASNDTTIDATSPSPKVPTKPLSRPAGHPFPPQGERDSAPIAA